MERIVTKGSSDQRRKGVWMLIGYVVVGTLSLPFPWARYFPILYLLPLLLVLLVCRKWLVKVLVAVYLANSVMVAYFLVLEYGFMGKEKILQARFIHQLAMQQKSFREPQVVFSAEVTPSNLGIKLSQTYGFPLDALQELSEYELLEKCGVAEVVHSIVTCPNGGYLFTEIDFLKSRFYLP